jgi:hypothetical protein
MELKSRLKPQYLIARASAVRQSQLLPLMMIVMFFLAGAVRLYRIEAPGVLIDREYTSAVFARDFYFRHVDSIEGWRKEMAGLLRQNQPILEPPVTEYLVSLIYRVAGREQFQLARFLTTSFWLVGGIFLYKTAKILGSTEAAIIATAYYLFLPASVLVSRSFQPDSLMMMLFLISLFLIVRYDEESAIGRLVAAAGVSGLALLIRPLVLFTIFGALIALAINRKGSWLRFLDRHFWLFVILAIGPTALYYGYGILIAGFMRWKVTTSFLPHLFLQGVFWREWLLLCVAAVSTIGLLGAFAGLPLQPKGRPRALLIGLWIGYVLFGLAFNYHIHTHGYYQAQLIPIIALSLGPLVTLVSRQLKQTVDRWYWWLPVVGALLLALVLSFEQVRSELGWQQFESQETAREIGALVNHSTATVFLSPYYGMPLQYYGELTGAYWPRPIAYRAYRSSDYTELSIKERLDRLGFAPEYFVITAFREFRDHHDDLAAYLDADCLLVADNKEYLIYNRCQN